MAHSGKSRGFGFQHTPIPLVSVIKGRNIECKKWQAKKPGACSSDYHFEKLTNEMKRHSVIRSRRFNLPPLDSSQRPRQVLCAPSPLENSPLTGKKISIRRKNNPEAMWRPSEAEPGNTIRSFLGYDLLHDKPPLGDPYTWFQLEKEPARELLASEYFREFSTIQSNSRTYELQVCRNVIGPCDAHQGNKMFYSEPGMGWVVLPVANFKGNGATCTVSGHEPVKVKVRGAASNLGVFHMFQTELLFDKTPSEVLIEEPLFTDVCDSISGRDFAQGEFAVASSSIVSDSTDAVFSNLSTGYSTATQCYHQLLDDIQEQEQDLQDDSSTRSKFTNEKKIHIGLSGTSEGSEKNDESVRARTVWYDKDNSESRVTATSTMPELWVLDSECESKVMQIPRYPQCSKMVLQALTGVYSEDFTKNYTPYNANESWEKSSNIEAKLKRPPQRKFSFSKIDVHHIQSENRKDVMQRLTKLPIRCQKVVQKSTDISPQDSCTQVAPMCTRSFSQPENSTYIPTINLQLDVNVEKNKVQLSLPAPNPRLLNWYSPVANKGNSIERAIQDTIPTCSGTQFVFVGKRVLNSFECKDSSSPPICHHTNNAYKYTNGVTNMDVNSPNGQVTMYAKHSESSKDISNTFSSEERPTAPSYNSQPNNQESNINVSVSDINGYTEHHDCQGLVASAHDFLSAWDSLPHRACDSISEVEQPSECNRRHKEESAHQFNNHFSFRSVSTTAISVSSLDDVPYNSPAESPCRNNSPVYGCDYLYGLEGGQIPESLSDMLCHTHAEDDSDGNDYCLEKLDVLPTGVMLDIDRHEPTAGPVLHEDVEKTWTNDDKAMSRKHHLGLQGNTKQRHEDDTVVSDSTIDLSPRSHDSVFFDVNEDIKPLKFYSTSKVHKQSNRVARNTQTKSGRFTEVGQLTKRETFGESSTLQQLPLSAMHPSLDPKVMELITDESFMHGYTAPDTRGINQTEEVSSKKGNVQVQQEPVGHVYKNVRFADVDKVISFTVPDLTFPVPVRSFNGMTALRTPKLYGGTQGSSCPVLHKQTLQLAGYPSPMRRGSHVYRRSKFSQDATKLNPLMQETLRSQCLRDMKWSAHSYRSRYLTPNCMIIRGKSLELRGDGIKGGDPTADNPCNASVMYTICQKCEDELNVKFGSRCHAENDIAQQKIIVNTCRVEGSKQEVPDAVVGGLYQAERSGCAHRHEGCCNLCNQINSWTSYSSGAVQRE